MRHLVWLPMAVLCLITPASLWAEAQSAPYVALTPAASLAPLPMKPSPHRWITHPTVKRWATLNLGSLPKNPLPNVQLYAEKAWAHPDVRRMLGTYLDSRLRVPLHHSKHSLVQMRLKPRVRTQRVSVLLEYRDVLGQNKRP